MNGLSTNSIDLQHFLPMDVNYVYLLFFQFIPRSGCIISCFRSSSPTASSEIVCWPADWRCYAQYGGKPTTAASEFNVDLFSAILLNKTCSLCSMLFRNRGKVLMIVQSLGKAVGISAQFDQFLMMTANDLNLIRPIAKTLIRLLSAQICWRVQGLAGCMPDINISFDMSSVISLQQLV